MGHRRSWTGERGGARLCIACCSGGSKIARFLGLRWIMKEEDEVGGD